MAPVSFGQEAGAAHKPERVFAVTRIMKSKTEWFANAKPCGKYRSQFEATIAAQLDAAGVVYEHEPDRIRYRDQHGNERVYIPDFKVYYSDPLPDWPVSWWEPMYIEAKGWMDEEARLKMQAVRWSNPKLKLGFVFQSEKTKVGLLKSTGPTWAIRNGFEAAVKEVPASWLHMARMRETFDVAA